MAYLLSSSFDSMPPKCQSIEEFHPMQYACVLNRTRSAGNVFCLFVYKGERQWIATIRIDLGNNTIENISDFSGRNR